MMGMPDLTQLKRIAFRVEKSGRVKDLRGFVKGYSIPDHDSDYARKMIARLATEDIKIDIDETYKAIREGFAFKRKELESSTDAGMGVIHTPRFDYSISLELDPENTSTVTWRREIGSFPDPATVRSPEFEKAFGKLFNVLVFEFVSPINVEDLVDQIEDDERPGVKVSCASDASTCEITLTGFLGSIQIDRTTLKIEGRSSPTAASLLDQFFEFLKRFPRALG